MDGKGFRVFDILDEYYVKELEFYFIGYREWVRVFLNKGNCMIIGDFCKVILIII